MSDQEKTHYAIRTLALILLPDGENIFCEAATRVGIDDGGAGEFVILRHIDSGEKFSIDPSEWPLLRAAINRLVKQCRT